jgi:Ca2+-binding EF-hand superfamily protein
MGFHVAGNCAILDSNGFLVAHETPLSIDPPLVNPDMLSFKNPWLNRAKRRRSQEKWAGFIDMSSVTASDPDQCCISLAKNLGEHPLGHVAMCSECCWICDRWRPIQITWTPGKSGLLHNKDIDSVYAYLSIDSFRQPTRLECEATISQTGNEPWQGYVMLPPSSLSSPLLVVFSVNGCLVTARDMPTRTLVEPIRIEAVSVVNNDTSIPGQLSEELQTDSDGCALVNIANIVQTSLETEDAVGLSICKQPLVITEDIVEHGRLVVAPRTVIAESTKVKHKWTRIVSVWASWAEDDVNFHERMLEHDIWLSKAAKLYGNYVTEQELKDAILPHYGMLVTAYKIWCAQGTGHGVFGTTYNTLVTMGNRCDIFDDDLSSKLLINNSIAACAIDSRQKPLVHVRADNVIVRFQFIETLIRCAHTKYVASERTKDVCDAMQRFCKDLRISFMLDYRFELDYFRSVYFVEEVDIVMKNYIHVLRLIFDIYVGTQARSSFDGMMLVPAWTEFLNDCEAFDDKFVRRKSQQAFVYGQMWQIDEVSTDRHMHLSFVEFLVSIGAVVFMRRFWHEEEYADLIQEFLEESVVPLVEAKASISQKDALAAQHNVNTEGGPMHISQNALRSSFEEVFRIADEDHNGTLTLREFRNAFRNPTVLAVLGGKNSKIEDFIRIFESYDDDGNKTLTVDEALRGFSTMRKLEMSYGRAYAFVESLCTGNSHEGVIDAPGLLAVLDRPATQRKLMRLSFDPDTVSRYITDITPGSGASDVETLVPEVVKLRTGGTIPKWKIVLKQVFEEADTDHGGSVSKKEWKRIMESQTVALKFEKSGISKGVLEICFDLLDVDGSNDLTEAELVDGFERLQKEGRMSVFKPSKKDDTPQAKRDKEKVAVKRIKREKTSSKLKMSAKLRKSGTAHLSSDTDVTDGADVDSMNSEEGNNKQQKPGALDAQLPVQKATSRKPQDRKKAQK